MQNKFWLCVALAVVAAWYAFVFAGPRQVYVEVAPELVEQTISEFAKLSDESRASGKPVMGEHLRAIAKSWDASGCGPGYDFRVLTDGGDRWVLAAMPRAQRVDKTTWIESILYLRETTELWPMITVRCDEPGYHSDGGQSVMMAASVRDTSAIHIERRVEPSPLGNGSLLTMRSARYGAIESR